MLNRLKRVDENNPSVQVQEADCILSYIEHERAYACVLALDLFKEIQSCHSIDDESLDLFVFNSVLINFSAITPERPPDVYE